MKKCSQCNFPNSILANFCGGCGKLLTAAESEGASASNSISLTLEHNKFDSKLITDGMLRQVTVMFVDISASFELVRENDPELVKQCFDFILNLIAESVHKYEGTVAQVLGDGVMALFGVPKSFDDHAARACYSALGIQEAIHSNAGKLQDLVKIVPLVRIGLNSGSVIIESVSSDLSLDYRALGSTTHMASRMEQLASPGTIRITRETMKLAGGHIECKSMGPGTIKGISEPVETYELTGRTSLTRFEAQISKGVSPFVGRTEELNLLTTSLAAAQDGEKQSVLVVGEAGVGKSRLLHEFLSRPTLDNCSVIRIEGLAHKTTPFAPLRSMLQGMLDISDTENTEEAARKLQEYLGNHPQLEPYQSELQSLLDLPVVDELWRHLDPLQRRTRIFMSIWKTILDISNGKTIILVCEDLHWFDTESVKLTEIVVNEETDQGVLILATLRPDWDKDNIPISFTHTVEVTSLNYDSASELLSAIIGMDSTTENIKNQIIERSYGNPLFIEELINSLVETKRLVGESGNYKSLEGTDIHDIPPSVESVITSRIDRLNPDFRDILTTASVFGEEVNAELLSLLLDVPAANLEEHLNSIANMGMLVPAPDATRRFYRFKHTTIREVLYQSLLNQAREELHAKLVAAYEDIYAGITREKPDQLAYHAYQGRLWEKSARYHLASCIRASGRSANKYAKVALQRGIESLEQIQNKDSELLAMEVDLRLAAQGALLPLGEIEEILKFIQGAESIAQEIADKARMGAALSQSATVHWLAGNHERARSDSEKALTIASEQKDYALKMRAEYNLSMILHACGEFSSAISLLNKLLEAIPEENKRRRFGWVGIPTVFCRTFMGSSLMFLGRLNDAVDCLKTANSLADEVRHPYSQTLVKGELGFCYLYMGETELALPVLEEAFEICNKFDIVIQKAPLSARLCDAMCELGRLDEAQSLISNVFTTDLHHFAGHYALNYIYLANSNLALKSGDFENAIKYAKKSESVTRESGEMAYNALSLTSLADAIITSRRQLVKATSPIAMANKLAEKLDLKPVLAKCSMLRGRAYYENGLMDEARKELGSAENQYRELGLGIRARECNELQNFIA